MRREQRNSIRSYAQSLPSDQPIIIAGDLNTGGAEIPAFLSELNAAHAGFDDTPIVDANNRMNGFDPDAKEEIGDRLAPPSA